MKRQDLGKQAAPGPTWAEMDQRIQAALHCVAAPPAGGNRGIPGTDLIPGMSRNLLLMKPNNVPRRPGTGAISESASRKELAEIAKHSAKLLLALQAAHGPTLDALAITRAHYDGLMRDVRLLGVFAGVAEPLPQPAHAAKGAPTKTAHKRIAAQVWEFYVMLAGSLPARTTNGGVSDFQILLGEVFLTLGIGGNAEYHARKAVEAAEKNTGK